MAITDELRSVAAKTECANGRCEKLYRGDLETVADRIDAEHAEAQRRWMAELDAAREQSFSAGFDDGFASADDWLAQHEDAMREHGWVKLPVDADGIPIHIGDRMENGERVERIMLTDGSWEPSVYLAKTPHVLNQYFCSEISHYHEPTVEDVLREFALACENAGNAGPEVARIAAEYAAKLQLRGAEE